MIIEDNINEVKMQDKYIDILKQLEGFRDTPYKCSAGVWTIGYGHSSAIDNRALTNKPITEAEATDILREDISRFESVVRSSVTVPLTEAQHAALTFFCFNIGASAFKKSTLLKKLNSGDYNSVPGELLRWNKVSGRPSVGLSSRRHREIELWLEDTSLQEDVACNPQPHGDMNLPHKDFAVGGATAAVGLLADRTGSGVLQWTFAILIIVLFVYCFIMYRNKLDNIW